jgi:hypothetical protein
MGDGGHGNDPIYCWYCDTSGNPYDRGMVHIFSYGEWHNNPSADCCFKTFYRNNAPDPPSISGPTSGKIRISYDFKFMAYDQDDNDLYYYIDWDDGYIEDWIGPYGSTEEITRSHKWDKQGDYVIRAKVKDTYNMESYISTFQVTIPRVRSSSNLFFLKFLEKLPIFEMIFSQIMNL